MKTLRLYGMMLMSVLVIALFPTACAEKDDEDDTPSNNTVPINSADWQTVPATGGTIEKGDIALTFPSGTFDADTKVAITNVGKGKIGGNYEVSPFYQITMPMTTDKPFTVSIKADKAEGDVCFVVHSLGYAISLCSDNTNESLLEADYINGEYTTTIPVFDRSESKENTSLVIGVGRMSDNNSAARMMTTRANNSVIGKEGNVKWDLTINYGYIDKYSLNYQKVEKALPDINLYIKESIRIIHGLGFKVPDGTTLHYYINAPIPGLPENEGNFSASALSRDFDCINLLDKNVLKNKTKELKMTIIHETLHNYQSYYLPGINYKPWGSHNTMFESGAVWIEKYMNNGKLNDTWLMNEAGLVNNILDDFRIGLSRSEADILGQYYGLLELAPYGEYGYAQAPLLYYMISKNSSRGYDDTAIYSLYNKYWKKISEAGYTFIDVLDDWYFDTFNEDFFDGAEPINDYYLSLWKGQVMTGFSFDTTVSVFELKNRSLNIMNEKNSKFSLNGKVYPYGCEGLLFCMDATCFKDSLLNDDEMVVKQEADGVKTYLLYACGTIVVQWSKTAVKGDSIVVPGTQLEELRKNINKNRPCYFFLLTLREACSLSDTGTIPTQTSVELRKIPSGFEISPEVITAEEEGGAFTVSLLNTAGAQLSRRVSDNWIEAEIKGTVMAVTVKANNTDRYRTGSVVVTMKNSQGKTEEKTLKVSQYGGIELDKTTLTFDVTGGTEIVNILTSMKTFTVNPNGTEGWVTINQDDRQLTITVSENKGVKRSGTIIITGYSEKYVGFTSVKLQIIQDGTAPDGYANVTPTLIEFPAYGGVTFVDTEYDYQYESAWFEPDPAGPLKKTWGSGIYSDQCYVTAAPNTTGKATVDTLIFAFTNDKNIPYDDRFKIPVIIKQKAGPATLQDMMKIMAGTWISTEESNDTWQKRLKINGDGTYSEQERTRSSSKKAWSNWSSWRSDTYTVTSYDQGGGALTIHVKQKSNKNETFFGVQPHSVIYYGWHLVKEE